MRLSSTRSDDGIGADNLDLIGVDEETLAKVRARLAGLQLAALDAEGGCLDGSGEDL
jgi:hypothetical protein